MSVGDAAGAVQSAGVGCAGMTADVTGVGSNCCGMNQAVLGTGQVTAYRVNADPTQHNGTQLEVQIQPATAGSAQVWASCLLPTASVKGGASCIPRVGERVYYLQVAQYKVCLGSIFSSAGESPFPGAPTDNPLRATGLRVADVSNTGGSAAIDPTEQPLIGSHGLLESGTKHWPAASSDSPKLDSASPGLKASITPVQTCKDTLNFNEVSIQSRRADQSGDTGGVHILGQDFISSTTTGSASTTALGNISVSAGDAIHIESASQITLKVGPTGISITEGGIVLSQNALSDFGLGTTLSVGQSGLKLYGMSAQIRTFSELSLASMCSKLTLAPMQATLSALVKAEVISGWYNYASMGTLAAGLFVQGAKMCEGAAKQDDSAVGSAAWGLLDDVGLAMGIQLNFATTAPWRSGRSLPAIESDNSWMAIAIAVASSLIAGGVDGSLEKTITATASGFVAKKNEAYVMAGNYLPTMVPRSLISKAGVSEAMTKVMSEQGTPGFSATPIPVFCEPETGRCLIVATDWADIRTVQFPALADASLRLSMLKLTGTYGPFMPLVGVLACCDMAWGISTAKGQAAVNYAMAGWGKVMHGGAQVCHIAAGLGARMTSWARELRSTPNQAETRAALAEAETARALETTRV